MGRKTAYLLAAVAGAVMLGLLKLMYDMSVNLARMTSSVEAMAGEMEQMDGRMEVLVTHVGEMRRNMDRMGRVFEQSGAQMERLNPLRMMENIAPGGRKP